MEITVHSRIYLSTSWTLLSCSFFFCALIIFEICLWTLSKPILSFFVSLSLVKQVEQRSCGYCGSVQKFWISIFKPILTNSTIDLSCKLYIWSVSSKQKAHKSFALVMSIVRRIKSTFKRSSFLITLKLSVNKAF